MNADNLDHNLVGVLFPGIVKNDEKAIQCLGGIKQISEVMSTSKKRLSLSFQPDNPLIKKAYSDTRKAAGVLLKVKVKKTKINNEVKREVLSTEVLGRVEKMYRFEGLSDFQYLPVEKDGSGKMQCILEKTIPSGLDTLDFMSRDEAYATPHIIPTPISRLDKPCGYRYTDKKFGVKQAVDDEVTSRRGRNIPLPSMRFNLIDDFPTEPDNYYVQRLKARLALTPSMNDDLERVKKKFEERPIWVFNGLLYHTKVRRIALKVIVPYLAYVILDGPWRKAWIKYGYDPRKDPTARFYQTLDFRIRRAAGVDSMVSKSTESKAEKSEDHVAEGAVIFRPGVALSQRQVFYQYCDIKLPEVEEILSVKPQPGYLCHPTRGWLPPHTDATVRDHLFRYAKQMLLANHSADLKFEQASSEDEQEHSDDDEVSMASLVTAPATSST